MVAKEMIVFFAFFTKLIFINTLNWAKCNCQTHKKERILFCPALVF